MIDIKGITKSFGSLQVLKGIDMHIDKGEVVSIVGPSGAGKTTLLQIIGTLDRPDSGSVCVDSIDTTQLSQKKLADFRNRHIGFVFQFHQQAQRTFGRREATCGCSPRTRQQPGSHPGRRAQRFA